MSLVLDVLSWVLLMAGGGLGLIAGIGVLRLPDMYSRCLLYTSPSPRDRG